MLITCKVEETNVISSMLIALLRSCCQTRPSNERTLRRCLKARVGMTKRGGACASLAERGRLRRPERGDYLSFVAYQTRASGRHVERVSRTFHVAGAFSPEGARTILDRPRARHYPPRRRFTVGTWPIASRACTCAQVVLDRTHADFSAAASPIARKAWKRIITRECAHISLECKDANDDRTV